MNEKENSTNWGRIGITAVLVILACQMWDSNSDMFLRMAEAKGEVTNWGIARCVFLALAYSTVTAMVIRKLHHLWHKLVFGFLDGFTVFMHFQSQIESSTMIWIGSTFYAIYSFYLIYIISIKEKDTEPVGEVQETPKPQAAARSIEAEEPKETQAIEAPKHEVMILPIYDYPTINSLNGAWNRGKRNDANIENYLAKAAPEAVEEFKRRNPTLFQPNLFQQ